MKIVSECYSIEKKFPNLKNGILNLEVPFVKIDEYKLGMCVNDLRMFEFMKAKHNYKVCFTLKAPETRDKTPIFVNGVLLEDEIIIKQYKALNGKLKKELEPIRSYMKSQIHNSCNIFHCTYLMNLGTEDPIIRKNSIEVLLKQMWICKYLGFKYLTIHPGTTRKLIDDKTGFEIFCSNIEYVLERIKGVTILVENLCNNNGQLFSTPEQILNMFEFVKKHENLGICWDTAHGRVAGYEPEEMIRIMLMFGDKLKQIHFNNAKKNFKPFIDRHENIFQGDMEIEFFIKVIRIFNHIPKMLETPTKDLIRLEEIYALRDLANKVED